MSLNEATLIELYNTLNVPEDHPFLRNVPRDVFLSIVHSEIEPGGSLVSEYSSREDLFSMLEFFLVNIQKFPADKDKNLWRALSIVRDEGVSNVTLFLFYHTIYSIMTLSNGDIKKILMDSINRERKKNENSDHVSKKELDAILEDLHKQISENGEKDDYSTLKSVLGYILTGIFSFAAFLAKNIIKGAFTVVVEGTKKLLGIGATVVDESVKLVGKAAGGAIEVGGELLKSSIKVGAVATENSLNVVGTAAGEAIEVGGELLKGSIKVGGKVAEESVGVFGKAMRVSLHVFQNGSDVLTYYILSGQLPLSHVYLMAGAVATYVIVDKNGGIKQSFNSFLEYSENIKNRIQIKVGDPLKIVYEENKLKFKNAKNKLKFKNAKPLKYKNDMPRRRQYFREEIKFDAPDVLDLEVGNNNINPNLINLEINPDFIKQIAQKATSLQLAEIINGDQEVIKSIQDYGFDIDLDILSKESIQLPNVNNYRQITDLPNSYVTNELSYESLMPIYKLPRPPQQGFDNIESEVRFDYIEDGEIGLLHPPQQGFDYIEGEESELLREQRYLEDFLKNNHLEDEGKYDYLEDEGKYDYLEDGTYAGKYDYSENERKYMDHIEENPENERKYMDHIEENPENERKYMDHIEENPENERKYMDHIEEKHDVGPETNQYDELRKIENRHRLRNPENDVDMIEAEKDAKLYKTLEKNLKDTNKRIRVNGKKYPKDILKKLKVGRQRLIKNMKFVRDRIKNRLKWKKTPIEDDMKIEDEENVIPEEVLEEEEILEINLSRDAIEIERPGVSWEDFKYDNPEYEELGTFKTGPPKNAVMDAESLLFMVGTMGVQKIISEVEKQITFEKEVINNRKVLADLRYSELVYVHRLILACKKMNMKNLDVPREFTNTLVQKKVRTSYAEYYGPYVLVFVEWCAKDPTVRIVDDHTDLQIKCDVIATMWRKLLRVAPLIIYESMYAPNDYKPDTIDFIFPLFWWIHEIPNTVLTSNQYPFAAYVYEEYNADEELEDKIGPYADKQKRIYY
jgi:hypothetical protein